jgi:hypothetical protein
MNDKKFSISKLNFKEPSEAKRQLNPVAKRSNQALKKMYRGRAWND